MPWTPGSNIIDQLVPTIDAVRASVHQLAGDRQYEVTRVVRTWPSGIVGDATDGEPTMQETLMTPPPLLEFASPGVGFEMRGGGKEETGDCRMSEVSLTFAEEDLCPRNLADGVELYYRVIDYLGNGVRTRYYVPAGPPKTDRSKNIGWEIVLHRYIVSE